MIYTKQRVFRLFTFNLLLVIFTIQANAQTLPTLSIADFLEIESKVIDSTSHAVILSELGKSDIVVDDRTHQLIVVHRYAVRIKIIDREGFDKSNFTIPLYRFGGVFEEVHDIKGSSHYYDGTKLTTTEMSKSAIFHEKTNEFINFTKFTLPNIKENSIIDVYYEIRSPNIMNYRSWNYQDDVPKLFSEYTMIIPATYDYNITLRGHYRISDEKSEILREHFLLNGRRFDCSKITYSMKDIPAFKEEPYMLAPKNYKSAMYFELKEYYLSSGAKVKLTKEWKDVDRELLGAKEFGGQIYRENSFKNIMPKIIGSGDNKLEKAFKIYNYIKDNIRWNRVYGIHSQFGLKDALEKKTGNVADINLGLIAALNAADLEAYPVMLSTRENGLPNMLHPVMTNFNYVIVLVKIDGENFFLDGTEASLPFGLLPLRCINGDGRVIYSKKSSEWIKLENKFSASKIINIEGHIDEKGVFTGQVSFLTRGLSALHMRNRVKSFPSLDRYHEHIIESFPASTVSNVKMENLENLNQDLIESFDYTINLYGNNNELIFSPLFFSRITKNPFNLEERTYQVDLGSAEIESTNISITLPEGFSLVDAPKNMALTLPENTARYVFRSGINGNTLTVLSTLSLNKAIYDVDEYFHLKEFYSRIIQHQKLTFHIKRN